MLEKRNRMTLQDVCGKSLMIEKRLFAISEFIDKNSILFYAAFKKEVQTLHMMRRCKDENKRIFLPVIDSGHMELIISELFNPDEETIVGKWGIPAPRKEFIRPVSPNEIDAVIVPGIAFDKTGGRIGFGGGYYDKFLFKLSPSVVTIGVCYDFQIKNEKLPLSLNDIKVKRIVTEKQSVNCGVF